MNGFLRKAIVIAAVGAFLSCSAAGQTETESAVAEEYSAGFAADAAAAPMMKAMRSANQSDAVPERKIVYRADLTIETTDLVGTREKILNLMETENGILEYNEQNEQQFYLSLKIPAEKFEEFYHLLSEWNKKFNLTRIIDANDCRVKHFLDSLLGEKFFPHGAACLEVGSGGAILPDEVRELLAVDMGCVGLDMNCTEQQVSICAKDSGDRLRHTGLFSDY